MADIAMEALKKVEFLVPRQSGADLVGKVGVCSQRRPGLITGRKALPWGESWVGVALDSGPVRWASREPIVIACTLNAYLDVLINGDEMVRCNRPTEPLRYWADIWDIYGCQNLHCSGRLQ